MKRTLVVTVLAAFIAALIAFISLKAPTPSLSVAEALVGPWRLERQELNGQNGDFDPLTLQISQAGDKLSFAFSVPANGIPFVSLTYTVRLDGSGADIKNANGQTIGTIQMKCLPRLLREFEPAPARGSRDRRRIRRRAWSTQQRADWRWHERELLTSWISRACD